MYFFAEPDYFADVPCEDATVSSATTSASVDRNVPQLLSETSTLARETSPNSASPNL